MLNESHSSSRRHLVQIDRNTERLILARSQESHSFVLIKSKVQSGTKDHQHTQPYLRYSTFVAAATSREVLQMIPSANIFPPCQTPRNKLPLIVRTEIDSDAREKSVTEFLPWRPQQLALSRTWRRVSLLLLHLMFTTTNDAWNVKT